MTSKAKSEAPIEAFNIYLPTYSDDGELIACKLIETYELGPSHLRPPLGARLQELEFLTGSAHLWEPVELADTPRGLVAKAVETATRLKTARVEQENEQAAQMQTQERAAKDRIAHLFDPEGHTKAQAIAAIEAEHDALDQFASADEKKRLAQIKAVRISEIEAKENDDGRQKLAGMV